MKAISLVTRLCRDVGFTSPSVLPAGIRLAILDAINGAIQLMDTLAGHVTKTTTGSFYLSAPEIVSIGVTTGSADITGLTFTAEQYGRTIRISGDSIDNQIAGESLILHPYGGTTGTVAATIYCDAVSLPEPYRELIGDPQILENRHFLTKGKISPFDHHSRHTGEPRNYWVEPNARNNSPASPAIIRFHPMPSQAYRLQSEVSLSPARVTFSDLLAVGVELPVRAEHVESVLFPMARKLLAETEFWKNQATKGAATSAGQQAEARYAVTATTTLETPCNQVGTPEGF